MSDAPTPYEQWLTLPRWFRIGCAGLVLAAGVWWLRSLGDQARSVPVRSGSTRPIITFDDRPRAEGDQQQSLTDPAVEEVEKIIRQFPSLASLKLNGDSLTAEHLALLSACRQLQTLDLADTDLNDEMAGLLAEIPSLVVVDLSGTFLSDDAIEALNRLPKLRTVKLAYTDVSLARIQAWREARPELEVWSEKYDEPYSLLGSIRWSDGTRDRSYPSDYVVFSNAVRAGQDNTHHSLSGRLHRSALFWPAEYWEFGDGPYEFRLTLDRMTSGAVQVTLTNGHPSPAAIEFVMPCTKAEALQSAKQPAM